MNPAAKIAVVIPSYRAAATIDGVLARIPEGVRYVFVVDDACPDHSGQLAASRNDPRVTVLAHARNLGVGAAMASGYRAALAAGADVVVKIDADGQMDPALIDQFVRPIAEGRADYTKGNRFFRLDSLKGMPVIRLLGNSLLSLVNKMSSGYWDIMDPTNGYTAIHARVLRMLPLEKLSPRYFFESDMLFRLGTLRAVVRDVPMDAIYEGAPSSLRIGKVLTDFPLRYATRVLKRVFYAYFLRDFNAGTVQLSLGALLVLAGSAWGAWHWWGSIATGQAATTGTVMLAALPILLGGQLLIAALNYDIANVPRRPLHPSVG